MLCHSQLALIGFIVVSGCQPFAINEVQQPDFMKQILASKHPMDEFDIAQHCGELLTVEGVLQGDWIRRESGGTYGIGSPGKVTNEPLRIRHKSQYLAMLGTTDEVAKQLADHAGKRVRLKGYVCSHQDSGRGDLGGQQGYSGPVPGHVVYYLSVNSCEAIATEAASTRKK